VAPRPGGDFVAPGKNLISGPSFVGIPGNEWSRKKIGKVAIINHATSNKSSYSGNAVIEHF
jgi:hypothetical protein